MDDLPLELARQARALRLSARNLDEADPQALYAFAREVLLALAARGLVAGEETVDCYAAPRFPGH
ncbi:hypothetical protein [Deinococcus hohokamensis]|uniref:DUF4089 domain-containing protein n=1 Tax=Deinococcus hohokamensis TaxID=309883 RepID=A0ABV9IAF8_9DEIO